MTLFQDTTHSVERNPTLLSCHAVSSLFKKFMSLMLEQSCQAPVKPAYVAAIGIAPVHKIQGSLGAIHSMQCLIHCFPGIPRGFRSGITSIRNRRKLSWCKDDLPYRRGEFFTLHPVQDNICHQKLALMILIPCFRLNDLFQNHPVTFTDPDTTAFLYFQHSLLSCPLFSHPFYF